MAGNRTIIGSEANDDRHVELDKASNSKVTLPVSIYDANGKQVSIGSGLVSVAYDTIVPNYSGSTTDVYVYNIGGTGGTTVATLTISYVDSTKAVMTSIVKT